MSQVLSTAPRIDHFVVWTSSSRRMRTRMKSWIDADFRSLSISSPSSLQGEQRDRERTTLQPPNHVKFDVVWITKPPFKVFDPAKTSSPPTVEPFQPPQNADHSPAPLNPVEFLVQATPPRRTDGERAPTLTEVNPDSGSTTGGARIWLKGVDFPALFPLFARFGNAVVPTVSIRSCLSISVSSCLLDLLVFQPSCM